MANERQVLLSYSKTSQSARSILAEIRKLGIPLERSTFPKTNQYDLIRWGSYKRVRYQPDRLLNSRSAVIKASNKIKCLHTLNELGIGAPNIVLTREQAIAELSFPIVARTTRNGSRGKGIHIVNSEDDFGDRVYELFTQYIHPDREYRYHIFRGEVIDVSKKVHDKNYDDIPNEMIRSHRKGWRFQRCRLELVNEYRQSVTETALAAVEALGLDFGAVDIVWGHKPTEETLRPYVLEINTAPGIEGSVLDKYVTKISEWLQE